MDVTHSREIYEKSNANCKNLRDRLEINAVGRLKTARGQGEARSERGHGTSERGRAERSARKVPSIKEYKRTRILYCKY